MAEYIDKQVALSFPFANGKYDKVHANEDFILGCESYKEWLENLPAVDAVPVRRGRWEQHTEIGWGSTWLCSECGEKTVESIMGEPRYKYCPMCGADMRGDK